MKTAIIGTSSGKSQAWFAPWALAKEIRQRQVIPSRWVLANSVRCRGRYRESAVTYRGALGKIQFARGRGKGQEKGDQRQVKSIKQNICNVVVKFAWAGRVSIWMLFKELFYDLHATSLNRCFKNRIAREKSAFPTKFPNSTPVCLTERIHTGWHWMSNVNKHKAQVGKQLHPMFPSSAVKGKWTVSERFSWLKQRNDWKGVLKITQTSF